MRVPFYKSLDREFELLGIKGMWVYIVLVGAGASVILGFIFGAALGSGIGIAIAVIGFAVCFFGAVMLQVKTPSRQIGKKLISSKVSGWVIRRETLSRILLEDPTYLELKKNMSRQKGQSNI